MRFVFLIVFLTMLSGFTVPKGIHSNCYDTGVIALTFDDGMSSRSLEIAAILEEKQIKATFFVIGNALVKNTNILLKQIYEHGHQIANHSWSHPYLTKLSDRQFNQEILETENGLRLVDPNLKLYIRLPYGAINQDAYNRLTQLGYEIVLWNMDLRDWNSRKTGDKILSSYDRIMQKADPAKDSFILILHEKEHTINVLPKIIDIAKAKGFRFVTIDNCLLKH